MLPRGCQGDHSSPNLILASDCQLRLLYPHCPCEGSSPRGHHIPEGSIREADPRPLRPTRLQPMSFVSHGPRISLKPLTGDGPAIKHMQARRWMRIRLEMSHEPREAALHRAGTRNTGARTPST